nr:uncharacterized mitochondrial protein AtMg00820-like [Ziziphus jujuba var. spinosa]
MINKNKTWELVKKPQGKKAIGVKWVFRTKLNADGTINKHKARLVEKSYMQQSVIDYGDTFAPVARHETIKFLLALATKEGWKVYQLDVKSAFLNGYLQEEVSEVQLADILTKTLPRKRSDTLRNDLSISSKSVKEEC